MRHRAKYLERARRWRKGNPERAAEKARKWVAKNPEKARAYKLRRRARERSVEGGLVAPQIRALFDFYEGKCLCCGEGPPTLDHVVPLSKGGGNTVENAQVLCKPCNSCKGTKSTDYRDPERHAEFMARLEVAEML